MKGGVVLIALLLPALSEMHAQSAPASPEPGTFEVEPPLLSGNLTAETPEPVPLDLAQAERKLARAREGAAGAERLFRSGVLARVEAENRALKVVQAETAVARARLLAAQSSASGGGSAEKQASARRNLPALQREAEVAEEKERKMELDLAVLNVRRQEKLLALGSGAKSALRRAQEKLDQLRPNDQ